MKKPLRISWGPFAASDAPAGYGVIAGQFARSLSMAGADMLGMADFGWDVAVSIGLPHAWPFPYGMTRLDLCWHTMFEMDHLPDGWADVLNRCALVWTPSRYAADLCLEAGVTQPVAVSGYGVDTEFFHPVGRRPHDKLRFLVWGPAFYGRKNLLMAIRAFYAADLPADEVELEIKVNETFGQPTFRGEDGANLSNIKVHQGDWQASQIADWLRTGDVLLYLSGGEGFGLQPLEAMACGVTCICADNTGMREYLNTTIALPVSCPERVLSPHYSGRFKGGPFYQWQPSFEQAVAHIRWCYAHRQEVGSIGQAAADYVADRWTWERAGRQALALLQKHFS